MDLRRLVVIIAILGLFLGMGRWFSKLVDIDQFVRASNEARAIADLESLDKGVRLNGVRSIERLTAEGPLRGIPLLLSALDDPDFEVGVASAQALESMVSRLARSGTAPEAVRFTLQGFEKGSRDIAPPVRASLARAIGSIASSVQTSEAEREIVQEALSSLQIRLKDDVWTVRAASARAIGVIVSSRVATSTNSPIDREALFNALSARFDDPSSEVRDEVSRALVKLGLRKP